ncbi:hypothetical protein CLOM_g1624 [Closterium sp. NIES-68]|nr:hypothetical protein CLOM_g1624 [Closterium sp. NIES-68]GJP78594.1 hypothetical protein CLOP_g8879 [Closterium sp. NIES-67]
MADSNAPADVAAGGGGSGAEEKRSKKWLPLESNPDVMNDFVRKIGFPASAAGFHDVYGLDADLLAMVPQPVLALLFLFLLPPEERSKEAEKEDPTPEPTAPSAASPQPFFVRQTIDNACGTIALLHAIGNNQHRLTLEKGSFLQHFFEKTKDMTAEERAACLEADTELEKVHSDAAEAGDTRPPSLHECVDLHFVAYVTVGGCLYELDGRKPKPIDHGPSSPDTLLQDAAWIMQAVITGSPNSLQFNVIAMSLVPPE